MVSLGRHVAQVEAATESRSTTGLRVLCVTGRRPGVLHQASGGSCQCFRGSNLQDKTAPAEPELPDDSIGDMQVGNTSAGPFKGDIGIEGNGPADTTFEGAGGLANDPHEGGTGHADGAPSAHKLVVGALILVFIQVL